MAQSKRKKADNAAVRAAQSAAAYKYIKVAGGRPVGRPPKPKVGGARTKARFGRCSKKVGRGGDLKAGGHAGVRNLWHMRGITWSCTEAGQEVCMRTSEAAGAGWGAFAAGSVPAFTVLGRLPQGEKVSSPRRKNTDTLKTKAGEFYTGAPLGYRRGQRRALYSFTH